VVPNANNSAYHIAARRERNSRAIWYCTQTVNAPIVLAHHNSASGRPPNRSPAKNAATSRRAKKPACGASGPANASPPFINPKSGSTSTGVPSGKLLYQCPSGQPSAPDLAKAGPSAGTHSRP
jgi:hypothetical protein